MIISRGKKLLRERWHMAIQVNAMNNQTCNQIPATSTLPHVRSTISCMIYCVIWNWAGCVLAIDNGESIAICITRSIVLCFLKSCLRVRHTYSRTLYYIHILVCMSVRRAIRKNGINRAEVLVAMVTA